MQYATLFFSMFIWGEIVIHGEIILSVRLDCSYRFSFALYPVCCIINHAYCKRFISGISQKYRTLIPSQTRTL